MNPAAAPLLELRDIHAAPPPGLWPPAPGWWLLAMLLAAVLVAGLIGWRRRYRIRRFRNHVMLELDSITNRYQKEEFHHLVAAISIWLRRIALQRYPQEQVASLTGSAWLEFLDATGGEGQFCTGVGRVLETGPYSPQVPPVAVDSLLSLVRNWAQKNLGAKS
jgi:hypothetical protein